MTIALRNDSAVNIGSVRAASLTGTIPAGTLANDVMVAFVTTNSAAGTISGPGGIWVQDANSPQVSANGEVTSCFYAVATGADANPLFTFNATRSACVWIGSYSGVDTATPRHTSTGVANAGAATTAVTPSITIATAGEMVVIGTGSSSGNAGVTFTPAAGFNEESDQTTTVGGGQTENAAEACDLIFNSTGPTGTMTVTATNSGAMAAIAIALNPAPVTATSAMLVMGMIGTTGRV